MKLFCIVILFIPLICSCQNDKIQNGLTLPPKPTDYASFKSVNDSIEFTNLISLVDSLVTIKTVAVDTIVKKLTQITESRQILLSSFEAHNLINKLFELDYKKAIEICFANYDVSLILNDPYKEDILIYFPFLEIAAKHLNEYEIIMALVDSHYFRKCLSSKEQVKNNIIVSLAISNSILLNVSPDLLNDSYKAVIKYIGFLVDQDKIMKQPCLKDNLLLLKEYLANINK